MYLKEFQFAVRSACHESTGFAPAKLFLGRDVFLKGDLAGFGCAGIDQPSREKYAIFLKNYVADLHKSFERARTLLLSQNENNKRLYDLRRRPNKLVVGDIVWRTNHILSNAIDNVAA